MEEKKIDKNTIIGFALLFIVMLWMMYQNQPTKEELEAQKKEQLAKKQQEEAETKSETLTSENNTQAISLQEAVKDTLNSTSNSEAGSFSKPQSKTASDVVKVNTELLELEFSPKGGHLSKVKLKNYVTFDSLPVYLIHKENSYFNIEFKTKNNRKLNSKDLYFEPTVSTQNGNTLVTMKLMASETESITYSYLIKPNDFMLDFSISSQGINKIIDTEKTLNLEWNFKGLRHGKSVTYENRYSRLTYLYEKDKIGKLSPATDDDDQIEDVSWISYRQHFFSSIIIPETPFEKVDFTSKNLVKDEEVDTVFTKTYNSKFPITYKSGEWNSKYSLYFGPTDKERLSVYEKDLESSIPYGWGIFGWINKSVFHPLFNYLSGFLPYGISIIVMTILIKLLLSFVQYKQFLSQAKMRILKPELDAIREKYKNNKLKAQQETMSLQNKAGASPLSGCLPGLMQIPVFYALFLFFPTAFILRQKPFLWANDLSSYDVIIDLPFTIPLYGGHVSLFPILAAVAIFFYMKLTTGDQVASAPTQEGMPDMSKMMKYMIYFSPILMMVFFNQYASGLSLYYFISNLISIGLLLVIKNYIIDEEKVLANIQIKKQRPKKENKLQRKMKSIMEQAEKQKAQQQSRKK